MASLQKCRLLLACVLKFHLLPASLHGTHGVAGKIKKPETSETRPKSEAQQLAEEEVAWLVLYQPGSSDETFVVALVHNSLSWPCGLSSFQRPAVERQAV